MNGVAAMTRVAAAPVDSRAPVADVVFLPFGVDGPWDEVRLLALLDEVRLLALLGCVRSGRLGRGVGGAGNLLCVDLAGIDDDGCDGHLDDIDQVVLGRAGGQGN